MTGLFSLTTKRQKKLHKFFSAVAIFSLFLQIGSGIFYFKPVLAEGETEPTATPVVEQAIETPVEPTPEATIAPEVSPVPEVSPSPEPTPATETPAEVTSAPTEEVTPITVVEENQPTSENTAPPNETGPPLDLEKPVEDPVSGQIVPTPTPIEKICLTDGQEIKETTNDNWEINQEEDWAQTKEPVKLGVKYIYPQENKVSVAFNCLPKEGAASLKIQKIKVSDLDLPDDIKTDAEFAYDITTGMENGLFEYDLTLPKPEGVEAGIISIDKSVDEALSVGITVDSVEKIESEKIKQNGDKVEGVGLDHFSIKIPEYTITGVSISIPSTITDCRDDTDGANDEPGQKDLTKFCQDPNAFDPLEITWNWDTIGMSGKNTADACALFDTDNDGNANYALCVSWEKTRQQISGSPYLYSCSDTRADRCPGNTPVTISHNSECAVDLANNDPFPSGDSYPQDTVAYCQVYLDDVGGVDKARPLDVCSYPSDRPNSDPSDCVLISETRGNLEIIKNVVPDDATTNWGISVNGPTLLTDTLIGDDSTGIKAVSGGTYTVTETGVLGTDISKYNSSWSCVTNGGTPFTGSGSFISNLSVSTGSIVICTFKNELKEGTITVYKDVQGPNGENVTDTSGSFTVKLDGNNAKTIKDDETTVYTNVLAGAHTISEESLPAGYSLFNITPDSDSGTPGAQITVTAGQNTDVYIVNRQLQSKLIVEKTVINDNGGTKTASDFSFSVDGNTPIAFEVGGQNDLTVNAGTYNVTEPAVSGYTTTYDNCSSVIISYGETETCTITNDDQAGTLIVKKVVINNNGGTLDYEDFSFSVNGGTAVAFEADGQNDLTVNAGTYNITEPSVTGYSTNYDNCSNVVIANGDSATCTITNNDQAGTLTVIKHVINDNGGTKVAGDFNITVTGNSPSPASFDGVESPGTTVTLNAGSYNVTENGHDGYTDSYSTDCTGTMTIGGSKTCTITNNDQAGTLTVRKVVFNDDGGTLNPEDFSFQVDSGSAIPFEADGQNDLVVNAGTYSVTEPTVEGYSKTYDNCSSLVVANGGSATCIITNDDVAPTLTLVKEVTNNDGGTATTSAWTLSAAGSERSFSGSGPQVGPNNVKAGVVYTLSEIGGPSGYTASAWNCDGGSFGGNTITLGLSDEVTCTITNDDIAPKLTLIKSVVNNNGGNAGVNDFGLSIGGTSVDSGEILTLGANTPYILNEVGLEGYTFISMTGDAKCPTNLGGTISLSEGDDITCTITNDDVAPQLTIVKDPTNDNGGNAAPDDFQLTVGGTVVNSGAKNTYSANTPYAINETQLGGYTFVSITGDEGCPANLGDTVTLNEGDDITCTITNDDQAPTITLIKSVDNGNGGNAGVDDFGLTIGGTSVTSGQTLAVSANTQIALDEVGLSGYNFVSIGQGANDSAKCPSVLEGTVTLDEGESITCTIANNDVAPTITLIKSVDNGNGGNAGVDDFGLTIGGTSVTSGQTLAVSANTPIALDEAGLTGYTFVSITGNGCPSQLGDSVTLDEGQDLVCTITNDDEAPTITLIKNVVNDNNGNAGENDFGLTIGATSVNSNQTLPVDANTAYILNEAGLTGYTFVSITGNGCPSQLGDSVTLDEGQDLVCTITNDDEAPKLTLIKTVVTDNGGNALPDDFLLTVGGNGVLSGVNNAYQANTPLALNEIQLTGYTFVSITGDAKCPTVLGGEVTLDEGDDITCTITNDDVAPTLTLVKTVVNDNGGDKVVADFPLFINGVAATSGVAYDQTANVQLTASETSQTGYTPSVWGGDCADDGTITLLPGDNKTCTITNSDIAPTITLIKDVLGDIEVNLNDFGLMIGGTAVNSGVATPVNANTPIEINEAGLNDFNFVSISGDEGCPSELGGTVTLAEGQDITCTITNEYNPPAIKLVLDKTSAEIAGKTASPGDTITYTLTITNDSDFTAFGVIVQDSLPDGFSYVSGTTIGTGWTASEPTISGNKLTWTVGNIASGGEVIINYDAQINSSQKDGSYPNVAIASGYNRKADGEIAYSGFAEFYTAVGKGISYSTSVGGGFVLGAATGQVLGAATGSPTFVLIMAILMILAGLAIFLLKKGRKLHV